MRRIGFLLAILSAAWNANARAEKPVLPTSYSAVSSDGRFLFVMIAPRPSGETAEGIILRQKYAQSGLYRNDGSREPLWTIKGYSARAYPASDGIHLACVSKFAGGFEPWEQCVRFFASGRLIRAYSVDDLTVSWLLPRTPSGRMWSRRDHFDEADMRYTVWTRDGSSFTFDVLTGEVVSAFVWWHWVPSILLAAGLFALLAWYLSRRFRQPRTTPVNVEARSP
jgi:hypothetical protein